jgi:hypothetical protein
MKNPLLLAHLFSLFTGGYIYILFRDSSLLLFGWIEKLGAGSMTVIVREQTLPFGNSLPQWVLFSLPDGLWLFSYVCFTLYLWQNSLTKSALLWVFFLPVLAILHEFAQLIEIMDGTFDPLDIFFYCIATSLPFVLFRKRINLVKTHKAS